MGIVSLMVLVIGLILYRKRRLPEPLEEEDEFTQASRGRSVSQPQRMVAHPPRARLASSALNAPKRHQSGSRSPRKPSQAELAQMEVYRKMSVIGIV